MSTAKKCCSWDPKPGSPALDKHVNPLLWLPGAPPGSESAMPYSGLPARSRAGCLQSPQDGEELLIFAVRAKDAKHPPAPQADYAPVGKR